MKYSQKIRGSSSLLELADPDRTVPAVTRLPVAFQRVPNSNAACVQIVADCLDSLRAEIINSSGCQGIGGFAEQTLPRKATTFPKNRLQKLEQPILDRQDRRNPQRCMVCKSEGKPVRRRTKERILVSDGVPDKRSS